MSKTALDGIRVCDFCWAWAGTSGTELLGFLGAEVIKVESWQRMDGVRMRVLGGTRPPDPHRNPTFNALNLNKLAITVDIRQPRGVELIKQIVKVSDVVTDNFAGGVLQRLGLGYEALREVRPDIIVLSMPGFGAPGPWQRYHGYAPTFEDLSGIADMSGYPDGRPSRTGLGGFTDFVNGLQAAFSILAALNYRRQTGEGQFIDLSQLESTCCLIGEAYVGYDMNGRSPSRKGNRDGFMAPHNCYPCQGEDKWVSIAIRTEEEWDAFCEAMGRPGWTEDERFRDAPSRSANHEELDRLVGEWTRAHTHYEVTDMLQRIGVAAMPSFNVAELVADPHLSGRDCLVTVEHPEAGQNTFVAPPWKLSATPARITRHAPMVGQHNEYVFCELLGMPVEEFAVLVGEQVIY